MAVSLLLEPLDHGRGDVNLVNDVIRHALQALNPNTLIVELATGRDMGVIDMVLTVPNGIPCPTGTATVASP